MSLINITRVALAQIHPHNFRAFIRPTHPLSSLRTLQHVAYAVAIVDARIQTHQVGHGAQPNAMSEQTCEGVQRPVCTSHSTIAALFLSRLQLLLVSRLSSVSHAQSAAVQARRRAHQMVDILVSEDTRGTARRWRIAERLAEEVDSPGGASMCL